MGPHANNSPLVAIVGPTNSGKSALAMQLADYFDIEIITADARTVYRGMDIGTAKPSHDDQHRVRHHLLDVVSPGEVFTVADFKRLANNSISDIASRNRLPIMVGGSGLYIYAVLYDFAFRGPISLDERNQLEQYTVEELQGLINERNLPMPTNYKNPRHLISVLQTGVIRKGQNTLRPNTLVLGIDNKNEQLDASIAARTHVMMAKGLESEVRFLVEQYGWDAEALHQTIGYEEFRPYFEGRSTIQEVVQSINLHTRRLAKRQRTWFKRNTDVHWISKTEEAVDMVTTLLNK